ncbi:MAG: alpha/beta hydrolase [Saprospiraceae bacterium]|nr:alpha/beta hydrolase [Saprospiraceae bacterium]
MAYYGNESQRPAFSNHSINVFFDGSGYVYPDVALEDMDFFEEKRPLLQAYYSEASRYNRVAEAYGLPPVEAVPDTDAIEALNSAVKHLWLEQVNAELAVHDRVVVLVHGYNNTYHELIGPYSLFQNRIDAITGTNNFYINVFWDGLTDNTAKDISKQESLFYGETGGLRAGINNLKIWRRAQHQALFAGMELRTLLRRLQTDSLTLVSHSLGARVVASTLFNIEPEDDWKKPSVAQARYLAAISADQHPAPQQHISVGMMAPAIGGKETFDDYFIRENAARSAADSSDFHFTIGFNTNDEVLRKFNLFGKKSANFLGDTSFGTLKNDVDSVHTLFRENGLEQRFDVVDFSKTFQGYPQNKHSMIFYLDNPNFDSFIKQVLED